MDQENSGKINSKISEATTGEVEQGFTRLLDFIKKKEQKNKKNTPPLSVRAVAISAYMKQKNLFPLIEPNVEFNLDYEAFKSSQSDL